MAMIRGLDEISKVGVLKFKMGYKVYEVEQRKSSILPLEEEPPIFQLSAYAFA